MKENISAFMDGELDEQAARRIIEALERDGEAIEAWRSYHLIRDALHDNRVLSSSFSARFTQALAKEPTLLAPRRKFSPGAQPRAWYAVAASLAAVALVGWVGFGPQFSAPQMTQAPAVALTPKPQVVPLPAGANDYLLAHQGFSPRVSLQGMAPYVRTVSEQGQERRR